MMRARGVALAALGAFAAVSVAGVLLRPLIPIDETRYVDVAWEMHQTGQWLLPTKNHTLYTDKPPLLFWLINLVWSVFGVSGVAARLVGPAFGLAMVAGVWALGRRLWDGRTGATAAAVLAGMVVFLAYGGATMFDTMLGCATLIGVASLWRAMGRAELDLPGWLGFGFAIAMGVYAKGPVIFLHLMPALLAAPLWADEATRPRAGVIGRGVGLALALALGLVALWVVPAAIAGGPEYRHMILWEQTAGRTVNSFAHARPWYWLIALMPVILYPWIWSGALWRGLARLRLSDRSLRLALVWAGAGVALFSLISGKQVHYLIPELPAVALIFARALIAAEEAGLARRNWLAAGLAVALGGGLIAAALGLAGDPRLSAQLAPSWVVIAIAGGLAVAAIAALRLPVVASSTAIGLALILALNLVIGLTGLGRGYDSAVIAAKIAPREAAGIAVVARQYHEEFGFEARLTGPVALPAHDEAGAWLAAHPGGVLLAECAFAPLPLEGAEVVDFNGTDWCLWRG